MGNIIVYIIVKYYCTKLCYESRTTLRPKVDEDTVTRTLHTNLPMSGKRKTTLKFLHAKFNHTLSKSYTMIKQTFCTKNTWIVSQLSADNCKTAYK